MVFGSPNKAIGLAQIILQVSLDLLVGFEVRGSLFGAKFRACNTAKVGLFAGLRTFTDQRTVGTYSASGSYEWFVKENKGKEKRNEHHDFIALVRSS